jgi:hypothetical protein
MAGREALQGLRLEDGAALGSEASAGGAAAAGGFSFQAEVTAWLATLALANAAVPWGLESAVLYEVGAETSRAIDDVGARSSAGGEVLVQAKRGLQASTRSDSSLAKALRQVVEQYREGVPDGPSQPRAIDPARDRLVLAVDATSSEPVRLHLPRVMNRVRTQPDGAALDEAARNGPERQVLTVVLGHLRREWGAAFGCEPTGDELHGLSRVLVVAAFDLRPGGAELIGALARLEQVLQQPERAQAAWSTLLAHSQHIAATRSWSRREDLVVVLEAQGHDVGPRRSLVADIQRLTRLTDENLTMMALHASLPAPEGAIALPRLAEQELAGAAGSLVVTGPPGAGKTALLHHLVITLRQRGEDVVVLAADALPNRAGQARVELDLENDLEAVFAGWPSPAPATLVLDGLDALRGEDGSRWLRRLANSLSATRWRVVASMRLFDLHHSLGWQTVFAGEPTSAAPERRDPQLANIRHVVVDELTDDELAALPRESPRLAELLAQADPQLVELLRNPYNLSLAAELLATGQGLPSLVQLRSQLELLWLYWRRRVADAAQGPRRSQVLARLCEAMVARRRLRVDAAAVLDVVMVDTITALLHDGVLREAPRRLRASGGTPVLFAHHVLFDFAVAALLLADEDGGRLTRLVARLDADPGFVVLARPSLDLHLADIWHAEASRAAFWRLALELAAPGGHVLAAIAATATAVREVAEPSDLAPLAAAFSEAGQAAEAAHVLTAQVASALEVANERGRQHARAATPAYAWLAAKLAETLLAADDVPHAQTLIRLVWQLDSLMPLRPGDPGATERAAAIAALIELALADPASREGLARRTARFLVGAVSVDPTRHGDLLRRTLASEVLAAWGVTALQEYIDRIGPLGQAAPDLAADVSTALHGFEETREEPTALYESLILQLSSTRKDDLRHARSSFGERFPSLLAAATDTALDVLVAAVEAQPTGKAGEPHRYPIRLDANDGYVRPYSRPLEVLDDYRSAPRMVEALAIHLQQLTAQPQTDGHNDLGTGSEDEAALDRLLGQLVCRVHHDEVWAPILLSGAQAPASLGVRLLPLLDTSALLAHPFTRYAAGMLIRGVGPLLTTAEHAALEKRILGVWAFFDEHDPKQAGYAEHARDQLLGCLDPMRVQLPAVQARLAELAAQAGPPELLEPRRIETYSRHLNLADRLADKGISESDVPAPLRQALSSLYDDIRAATSDGDTQQAARERLLDGLQAVLAAVDGELPGGPLHEIVEELTLSAAEVAAADPRATPDSPAGKLVLRLLLQTATSPTSKGSGSQP